MPPRTQDELAPLARAKAALEKRDERKSTPDDEATANKGDDNGKSRFEQRRHIRLSGRKDLRNIINGNNARGRRRLLREGNDGRKGRAEGEHEFLHLHDKNHMER